MSSEFDVFARYYELDQGGFAEDVSLYLELARRTGAPILELGCGTGRLLVPLAEAGYEVTGIDVSPAMLDVARAKVAARPELAGRVELTQVDARATTWQSRFALAFWAINSFMHLEDTVVAGEVLARTRDALRPGGLLVLDLFNPDPDALTAPAGLLRHEWTRIDPATGETVTKLVSQRADPARQRIDVTFWYDALAVDGTVRRVVAPFAMRYWWRAELELALERAGFRCEQIYGSYDLDAYGPESERLLAVAVRP
ncbi:MAG: class I SAM-dependent methyltransferase [Chloroflexi bacterium]|nr:class I SAM-dependent methyltransferase [Chloroflexota bacterium]